MKKMLVCMVLAMTVFTVSSFAQGGGGGQQRMERMKQDLKDSLGFTPAQVDSVVAVNMEFGPQRREIMMDQSASMDDKKAKMADLSLKMRARYKSFLSDDQITKLEAYQQRRMMGGRRGGGGGGNQ